MQFLETIFPMYGNHKANKKLKNKLNSNNKNESIINNLRNGDSISIDILRDYYNDTLNIKDKLEDKAKTTIVGVTITISLILGASNVLSNIANKFDIKVLIWLSFALFTIAVFYMLYAGIIAIKVLVDENIIYTIDPNNLFNEDNLRQNYDECIANNRIQNTIRNNGVFTSYECIRNSLFCLFLVLILLIVPYRNSYTQAEYVFTFSPTADNYLSTNCIKTDIEQTVENSINNEDLITNQEIGVIDVNNNVYIKYVIDKNIIHILMVEPYIE